MFRVLVYVVIVFALAAGFAWLADRPGALTLSWQGYEIETSLMFAAVAVAALIAAIALLGAIVRTVVSTPKIFGNYLGVRRRDRGYRALSRGMIAVGAGDTRTARRAAGESTTLLSDEPLTLLLTAQAAQLAGDAAGARAAFEALSNRPETRVLGLHGLFVEARRQGEHEAARHFAEEATRGAPRIAWAGTALFEYQGRGGDWLGALRTLSANTEAKLIDKAAARRLRAVLLTAQAMEIEGGDPDEARVHALEAHRLAPDLTEAAVVAGRLLARAGDLKRAARVLEAAWRASPHPEIAEAYAALRSGDSVRDRLKRMRRLAELRPHHPEGAMAVARGAIDARDWEAARQVLEGLLRSRPSERVCLLMAEIEAGEHGDEGRVRTWLTRAIQAPRDPVWVADGRVFARWAPVSPVTGRLDAFEWKVASEPLARPRAPEIDIEPDFSAKVPAAPVAAETVRLPSAELVEPVEVVPPSGDGARATVEAQEEPTEELAEPAPPTVPEPVVPPVPDDPGPDPGSDPANGGDDKAPRRFRLF
jgi:HemY protein